MFFFVTSRRRHTRFSRDWSSDVCSSDLLVLPQFDLGQYKDLEVEIEDSKIEDADVDKALEELRDRAANFVPVEGRPIADGDYAQLKLKGLPAGGGDVLEAESVLCHVGGDETMA